MKRHFHAAVILMLAACSPAARDAGTQTDTTPTDTAAATTSSSAPEPEPPATQEKPMSYYQDKVAEIHTTAGDFHLRFYPDIAPNHVKNFIDLAERGFYNGTKFHRVIPGFVIQGGDPNTISGDPATWGTGGSAQNVKAEFSSVPHKRGILSMARSGHPDSASSQFFVCVADVRQLDNNYTVFGAVTKGMDVVDKIVNAPARNERPENPVAITSVTIRAANADEKGPAPK